MEPLDFLRDLLLVFAVAGMVVFLFHRLQLPSVVGLLVAGMLTGPSGLSLIHEGERVKLLAEIGVVVLLFAVGLEFPLPRLVGMARAKALAMLGERLGAEQAQQWGLIHRVVDDAALRDEALTLARQLATQPSYGLALIKRALDASTTNTLDAQLDLERDSQRSASLTPDYAEGVRAFMEKRKPNFAGRKK